MATHEKPVMPAHDVHTPEHSMTDNNTLDLPNSWKYKRITIAGFKLPWFASPPVQLVIVAFVCFMCPGMFNALNGMGGGGQLDPTANNRANTALYSTFAVIGFFAGTFTNKLGIRTALSFGGIGYSVYVASYLCYNHTQNLGFTTFAGALLGVCAGLLWCAQGAIMMSYPPEESKGRYISWFWMIFNLGAVIGSLIPLGQNIHTTSAATVNDGTYVGFLVLTILGAFLAWTLVDARDVIRSDGSKVIIMKHPSWKSEIVGLYETFFTDPYIILLFPMFLASNWFYTYHFTEVNGAYFNTRTRALNGVCYYLFQIIGAYIFGFALDIKGVRRTTRAKVAWGALFAIIMIIWGFGYMFQKTYDRAWASDETHEKKDWSDAGYAGPFVLYMFYGFSDAAWQTCVYWFMGSLTNNSRKLANFAGFYKGIQSAGSAITWRLDDYKIPYMTMFASNWGLLAGSLLVALPVILWKVEDTVPIEKDVAFTDETVAEVAPKTIVTSGHHDAEKV
ncbi:MFS general substrate transporter [Dothidotthia symphoricarpi CBS 119687]|uniref:MFS general substrate transporter n=1 Tax=Dothidotthia symphoricarpi CBS 119687 TaxID=1392245 RepID=A0A6A6AP09_9PLEO|nr:MFS general substrate transporter [Dothidotthia symphoricarpi CBS 119687]KAF2133266.1 MFS general substrate transporter [Dothidotthia symphoricarpi CBS 119687]